MANIQTETIAAGGTLQVKVSSPSQVEVSNSSWGSLALTSSTGAVEEENSPYTANATFLSEMEDMLFTATGGSTYTISIKPLSGNAEPREFSMVPS